MSTVAAITAARRAQVEVWGHEAATGRDSMLRAPGSTASSGDAIADRAYANGERVLDYFHRVHGRDGWDNKGANVRLLVHAPDATNAYWVSDEQRLWFGDGDGQLMNALGDAPDVVAHEFTHAVIDNEVRLTTSYGQEGALHESFADVLATGIDGNWKIAESVWTPATSGDALRDLAHPVYAKMSDVPPWVTEVHKLADIPNHAAYLVAHRIGGDTMRHIWYHALTHTLRNNSGFAGARDATLAAAQAMYGKTSTQYAAVRDAWAAVGVDASTPKERPQTAGEAAAARLAHVAAGLGAIRRSH
jgi:bacillolysin